MTQLCEGKVRHDKERIPPYWNGQKAWGTHTPQEIREWLNQ